MESENLQPDSTMEAETSPVKKKENNKKLSGKLT